LIDNGAGPLLKFIENIGWSGIPNRQHFQLQALWVRLEASLVGAWQKYLDLAAVQRSALGRALSRLSRAPPDGVDIFPI
jgi:hypothetical protein